MSVKIRWEKKGLYRVFAGNSSGKEVLFSNLAIHGDSRFVDIKYVVNDFTQIKDFEVSDHDIKKIAVIDKVAGLSNANLSIAIVATCETLLAWIQLYGEEMQDSSFKCNIFDKLNDAYAWVND